jgi:glycosyltransferase involved in cell wall biosynthesis
VRILVATGQWFPDARGGSARVATETAHRLAAAGHEVTVLAPKSPGRDTETQNGTLRILRTLRRSHVPLTLTDVFETRRAARGLAPRDFDVLLAHQSTAAVGMLTAGLEAPLALVFHASAVLELRYLRSQLGWGTQRLTTYALEPMLAMWERLSLRRADRVLVLSEYSRSLVVRREPLVMARIRAVGGGVDVSTFTPGDGRDAARARLGIPAQGPLLLTVRRLEPRMGIEQLLYALRAVAAEIPVTLAVVGEGPLAGQLRDEAAELGVEDRIRFVGVVADDELRDWYRAANLFVLPTVAYEGFGLVTAEALACGTPVVGTPVGATPELLSPLDARLVARSPAWIDLAEAIKAGLELETLDLRKRCREYACARFSWDTIVRRWESVLAEAATSARGHAQSAENA